MDAERRDEERDPGEDHEERLERAEELRVEVLDVLRGVGPAGHRLDSVGEHRRDARREFLLRHAVIGAHEDARHLRRVVRDVLLRGIEREERHRDRADAVLVAERGDADDLDLVRFGRRDRRGVADLQVAVLRRAPVDHDLVRRLGRAPFRDACTG